MVLPVTRAIAYRFSIPTVLSLRTGSSFRTFDFICGSYCGWRPFLNPRMNLQMWRCADLVMAGARRLHRTHIRWWCREMSFRYMLHANAKWRWSILVILLANTFKCAECTHTERCLAVNVSHRFITVTIRLIDDTSGQRSRFFRFLYVLSSLVVPILA